MLIEFDRVEVHRGSSKIIRDLNLSFVEHRIGIIGVNGAGKSTLARLINGLIVPTSGQVRVEGLDVQANLKLTRRRVGFVFQDADNQIVFPVVREDLAFGLKSVLADRVQREVRVEATLESLGIHELIDQPVSHLSGGQKQLVSLAGVLCREPDILVFDEPTAHLDLQFRNRFVRIMREINKPAVVLTHDLPLLADFDRVIVMDQGTVVFDDKPLDAIKWYEARCA